MFNLLINDCHFFVFQNDFTADYDKRLEFISGYSGNYGLAIVTKTKAGFWTDELHHYQANNELSCDWTLYRTDNMMVGTMVVYQSIFFYY